MKKKKQKKTKTKNKNEKIKTKYPKSDSSSKSLSDENININPKIDKKNNENLTDEDEKFIIDNKELEKLTKQYNEIEDYDKDEIIENKFENKYKTKNDIIPKEELTTQTNIINKIEFEKRIDVILKQPKLISKTLTFITDKQRNIFEVYLQILAIINENANDNLSINDEKINELYKIEIPKDFVEKNNNKIIFNSRIY